MHRIQTPVLFVPVASRESVNTGLDCWTGMTFDPAPPCLCVTSAIMNKILPSAEVLSGRTYSDFFRTIMLHLFSSQQGLQGLDCGPVISMHACNSVGKHLGVASRSADKSLRQQRIVDCVYFRNALTMQGRL